MLIDTKYYVGQTVWLARTMHTDERLPCPDCNDEHEFDVVTPGGTQLRVSCPRCSSYDQAGVGTLKVRTVKPRVEMLTIGQARVTVPASEYERGTTSYMCRETGVGSGSVYDEDELFPTEEEARAHAEALTAMKRAEVEDSAEEKWKRKVAKLKMPYAVTATGMRSVSDAWWKYRHLAEDIEEMFSEVDGELDTTLYTPEMAVDHVKRSLERSKNRVTEFDQKVVDEVCVAYDAAANLAQDVTHEVAIVTALRRAYAYLTCSPEKDDATLDQEMRTRAQGVYTSGATQDAAE